MEELEKQVNDIFTEFFRQEAGNRLSVFAWASFKDTTLKLIRDYKIGKSEDKTK